MNISSIQVFPEINPRKKLQTELIKDYMEIFNQLPPITIEKTTHILIDGFHRLEAARQLGRTEIAVDEVIIPNGNHYALACKLNCQHGLMFTGEEKHQAIVRLYREGYTQEALGEMWGYAHQHIANILAAEIRNRKLGESGLPIIGKITPAQEIVIRQAPPEVQDTIAEIVVSRVEEIPPTKREIQEAARQGKSAPKQRKPKRMKVSQVRTLADLANKAPEKFEESVKVMQADPTNLPIGKISDDLLDGDTVKDKIAHTISHPDLIGRFANLFNEVFTIRGEYPLPMIADTLSEDRHSRNSLQSTIQFLESILFKLEGPHE